MPQGSVLGPTLFSLFTNDLSKSLRSAETYLYADDTTIYCIAETMNLLTNSLNNVLADLQVWCDRNSMVPHPEKCIAMIMQHKSTFTWPIQALRLGNNIIKWTTSERLLEVQVDNKLSRSDHAANVARSFASWSLACRCEFGHHKENFVYLSTCQSEVRFLMLVVMFWSSFKLKIILWVIFSSALLLR